MAIMPPAHLKNPEEILGDLLNLARGNKPALDVFNVYAIDAAFEENLKTLHAMPEKSLESSLSHSDALTFADDTKISKVIRSVVDQMELQEDLCSAVNWANMNNMVLHDQKFELMTYALKPSISPVSSFTKVRCKSKSPTVTATMPPMSSDGRTVL